MISTFRLVWISKDGWELRIKGTDCALGYITQSFYSFLSMIGADKLKYYWRTAQGRVKCGKTKTLRQAKNKLEAIWCRDRNKIRDICRNCRK